MKLKNRKKFLAGGVIGLLMPIYSLVAWVYVAQTTVGDHAALQARFYNFFPSFLQNGVYLTFLGLLCCVLSFILCFMALPIAKKMAARYCFVYHGPCFGFGPLVCIQPDVTESASSISLVMTFTACSLG